MAGNFITIRDGFVSLLQNITEIQEVVSYPISTPNFEGYPAVAIYPTAQESDYQTTAQNEREYVYTCAVFYEIKNTDIGDALNALYELVDIIIDAVDQDDRLTAYNVPSDLPAGSMFIGTRPVPSSWGMNPEGNILVTSVTFRCLVSVEFV